jgi:hypothetical protein
MLSLASFFKCSCRKYTAKLIIQRKIWVGVICWVKNEEVKLAFGKAVDSFKGLGIWG